MPDVDSRATGRRDTNEIEVTDAMIAAGTAALAAWDVREDLPENIVADVYETMARVELARRLQQL